MLQLLNAGILRPELVILDALIQRAVQALRSRATSVLNKAMRELGSSGKGFASSSIDGLGECLSIARDCTLDSLLRDAGSKVCLLHLLAELRRVQLPEDGIGQSGSLRRVGINCTRLEHICKTVKRIDRTTSGRISKLRSILLPILPT